MDGILAKAQPVLDRFYEAVLLCGRQPPFKPTIKVATSPGPMRYEHEEQAVVLVPYEVLDPAAKTGMDRYAAIGTLGLSGREQYEEIFYRLLVAHELGHWLQMIAQRPLTRWQAEYEANRIMVAFWREHPSADFSTEDRLANFVVQPPNFPPLMPPLVDMPVADYFNGAFAEIEGEPRRYAAFQKMMVRKAMTETPRPQLRDLIEEIWPVA